MLTAREAAFFRDADPWGFILFARNVETPEQVSALCADLRAAVGRDAPILVDQEGGRVQRLRPPHWRDWRPALDHAAASGPRGMYLRARLMGAELRAVGIDTNCAPLADIAGDVTHPFLRNRCYGESVDTVVAAARATAEGLLAGGVLPVLKHIPGHGRATVDSHRDLPRVTAAAEDLRALDFAAFKALADIPMGMTAHIVFTALDPNLPATHSPAMMAVIRDEIGFDGLIMTDDISMEALEGSVGERAERALAAGCDVALHCNGEMDEMMEVAVVSIPMGPRAAARADRALGLRREPDAADLAALSDEMEALLASAADV